MVTTATRRAPPSCSSRKAATTYGDQLRLPQTTGWLRPRHASSTRSSRSSAVLVVDRALPADRGVVLGHFEQALARDAAATGDVLEERQYVVRAFGAAEAQQQDRVVRVEAGHWSIVALPMGTREAALARARLPGGRNLRWQSRTRPSGAVVVSPRRLRLRRSEGASGGA